MGSIFAKLDRMSSNVVDMINAQWVRIVPMTDNRNPNVPRIQDPARPVREIKGILEYASIEFGMELGVRKSYREANDLRNVSVGRVPVVSFDRKYFTDSTLEPRQGDRIIFLLDEVKEGRHLVDPNLPPFEAMDNQRDGLARLELRLIQLESQK